MSRTEELMAVKACLSRLSAVPQGPERRVIFWKLIEEADDIRNTKKEIEKHVQVK